MEWLVFVALIGGGIYWYRKRRGAVTVSGRRGTGMACLDGKLDELAYQLHEEKIKSEKLAQITYLQWKADKEREKRITLTTGVTLPRSQWREEQDRVFTALEQSMEQKRQLLLADQRREAETVDKVTEMERRTVEAIRRELGDDLE